MCSSSGEILKASLNNHHVKINFLNFFLNYFIHLLNKFILVIKSFKNLRQYLLLSRLAELLFVILLFYFV